MCLVNASWFKEWFLREEEDFATSVSLPPLSLSFCYSESLVNFFFLACLFYSSQNSVAWKAAAHVPSQPVNWRRCFPRPFCSNTMNGKLKKKSLQPMLMNLFGEFWESIDSPNIKKVKSAGEFDQTRRFCGIAGLSGFSGTFAEKWNNQLSFIMKTSISRLYVPYLLPDLPDCS